MSFVSRALRLLLAAACAALLAACSSEDARQAAAAASSLRSASEAAVASFAALQARAKNAPTAWNSRLGTAGIAQDQLDQVKASATAYAAKQPNQRVAELRPYLTPPPADLDRRAMQVLDPVLARARLMEEATAAYLKAWPLGTEHLVCMREHVVAYGQGMRRAALLLNAPTQLDEGGALYQRFDNELSDLTLPLQRAATQNDSLAAAGAVEALKARILEERRENAKVQLAFARSAEAAAVTADAIDKSGTVNFADLLGIAQSLLPRLSSVASQGEIDAAMTRLGGVAGRINEDTWVTQLAQRPLGTVQCATP